MDGIVNVCFRCGKTRRIVKTYKEIISGSLVVTNLTTCPDSECQAVIDKQLAKEQKFKDDMKLAGDRRREEQKERKLEDLRILHGNPK